ncbi:MULTISPECIES: DUF2391 family protein [Halococcus]|uniref:DUF2391 family protein n=1 Tax=Halococcus TaxID=2249 RepID=UPI000E7257B1|nr:MULTISPECIES: DUF2391 family protein [Halococcus]RJS98629.1 DUF2391 family protein [Halococcus sp. IIIV-5B]
MARRRIPRFKVADFAQQIVGGFLLAGPFVITEEVWVAAAETSTVQWLVAVGMVFVIGYGALYQADVDRDPDAEAEVGGVPIRFVSLMFVSFGSVAILMAVFGAPWTFLAGLDVPRDRWPMVTLHAAAIASVFSVVGAATADSVF